MHVEHLRLDRLPTAEGQQLPGEQGAAFHGDEITYKIDERRQGIVDSWPSDVDDAAARADWGFQPAYDFDRAFREYLIPTISLYYKR